MLDVGGLLGVYWCGIGEGTWWVPPQWGLVVGLGEGPER